MQQSPILSSPAWLDLFRLALANFFASGVIGGVVLAIVKAFLSRKKRLAVSAEVHESEARSAKTFAEARQLDLQTNISAGDAVVRFIRQLAFAHATIEQKNAEIERLSNENEAYEKQMRKAKSLLKLHNIHWDDEG